MKQFFSCYPNSTILCLLFIALFSSLAMALPDTVTFTVDRSGTLYTFQLERASVRAADCVIYTWDSINGYQVLDPQPEVRTYRGTVDEEANTLIVGWIDTSGNLRYSGFNPEWAKGWYWSGTVDVSSQLTDPITPIITPQTTGTGETFSRTVAAGVEAPHTYIPPTGAQVVCELALEIKYGVYDDTFDIDYTLGRCENEMMLYSYTMARDAMIHVQMTASCINLDEYFTSGYSLGGLRVKGRSK